MKELFESQKEIEVEEQKIDTSIFRKKSNAQTFPGWLIGKIKQSRDNENTELVFLLVGIYQKYMGFQKSENVRIESWRKKGGIKVWHTPDRIIVEFAGQRDKHEKPNIQRKEYTREEVNKMIICINKLKDEYNNKIPSRQLGEEYFHGNWDYKVFSKRSTHHKFTHLLNILDYYKVIEYNRAGFTSVIREVREIQEVLYNAI